MTKLVERLEKLHKPSYRLEGSIIRATEEFGDAIFIMLADGKWNCSRFGAREILSRYWLRDNSSGDYAKDHPITDDCPFIACGFATLAEVEEHFEEDREENMQREKEERRETYNRLKAEFWE